MKGLIAALSVLCLLAVPFIGTAAAESVKIGVVDIDEFRANSIAFREESEKLRAKFEEMQQKLEQEKNALREMEEEFRKQQMMLSLDAKDDKRQELEKKRRYYRYLHEDFTEQMKYAEQEVTRRVLGELKGVVEEIAKAEGYTLVIEQSAPGVIYTDDAVDITKRVTEAYDRRKKE
ncbi:MAG: OmpH family outer membrane protein [Desulfobacteraceae bacterium]